MKWQEAFSAVHLFVLCFWNIFIGHFSWGSTATTFAVGREDGDCNCAVQGHSPVVCANDISLLQEASAARYSIHKSPQCIYHLPCYMASPCIWLRDLWRGEPWAAWHDWDKNLRLRAVPWLLNYYLCLLSCCNYSAYQSTGEWG